MQSNKLMQWAFGIEEKRLLKKMFSHIEVQRVHYENPMLIVVNHSNFYDSLILFELQKRNYLPANTVAVMSADGLKQHKIFNGLGVIAVDDPVKPSQYKQMLHVLKTNPLLLFPQGKEEHQELRPLTLQKGAAALLQKNKEHHILFLTMYYSFTESAKAKVSCRFHFVSAFDRPQHMPQLHEFIALTMTEQLDILKEHVISGAANNYERLWL